MVDTSLTSIAIKDLHRLEYESAWDLQKRLQKDVQEGREQDTLILVEHEPVYTLGKNADSNHILQQRPGDIKTYRIERGGDVTYHGPGQLVGYPILDLNRYTRSVSWYMRTLEEVIISTLNDFGIDAGRKEGLTGVWVDEVKIAALGVRVSRWVTMHGFALNVHPDLQHYSGIIPCGIFEYGVTSMAEILERSITLEEVKPVLIHHFTHTFQSKEN